MKDNTNLFSYAFKNILVNISILVFSVVIILVIVEVIFPFLIFNLPVNLQAFINKEFNILYQNSKEKSIPKNYIALFGDSYAQGAGDWLLSVNPWKNEGYHSANLLNTALNKDVVTFGSGGADNSVGFLLNPISALETLRSRFDVDDPEIILLYFYEGNDLTDNFRVAKRVFWEGSFSREKFRDYLEQNINEVSAKDFWRSHTIFLQFFYNLGLNTLDKFNSSGTNILEERWKTGDNNVAIINGKEVSLPEGLQSPALELTEEELEQSLAVLGESLILAKDHFNQSEFFLVYIPSVLSLYDLKENSIVEVQVFDEERSKNYSSEFVKERNSLIKNRVKEISENLGIQFIDPQVELMKHTMEKVIHGPLDWKHFNKGGYEVFSNFLVEKLDKI